MKRIKSSIESFSSFQLENKQITLIKGGTTSNSSANYPENRETPSGGSGVGGTLNDPPVEIGG